MALVWGAAVAWRRAGAAPSTVRRVAVLTHVACAAWLTVTWVVAASGVLTDWRAYAATVRAPRPRDLRARVCAGVQPAGHPPGDVPSAVAARGGAGLPAAPGARHARDVRARRHARADELFGPQFRHRDRRDRDRGRLARVVRPRRAAARPGVERPRVATPRQRGHGGDSRNAAVPVLRPRSSECLGDATAVCLAPCCHGAGGARGTSDHLQSLGETGRRREPRTVTERVVHPCRQALRQIREERVRRHTHQHVDGDRQH